MSRYAYLWSHYNNIGVSICILLVTLVSWSCVITTSRRSKNKVAQKTAGITLDHAKTTKNRPSCIDKNKTNKKKAIAMMRRK